MKKYKIILFTTILSLQLNAKNVSFEIYDLNIGLNIKVVVDPVSGQYRIDLEKYFQPRFVVKQKHNKLCKLIENNVDLPEMLVSNFISEEPNGKFLKTIMIQLILSLFSTITKDAVRNCNQNWNIEQLEELQRDINETYNNIASHNNYSLCQKGSFNHLYIYSGAVFQSVLGSKLDSLERQLGTKEFTNFISSFINKKKCTLGELSLDELEKVKICEWL